jgi:hypothetical protein
MWTESVCHHPVATRKELKREATQNIEILYISIRKLTRIGYWLPTSFGRQRQSSQMVA